MAKKDEINNPQTAKQFEFNRELKKSEAAQERFNNLAQQAVDAGKKNLDQLKTQNSFERELLGTGQAQLELAKLFTNEGKLYANVTAGQLKKAQEKITPNFEIIFWHRDRLINQHFARMDPLVV